MNSYYAMIALDLANDHSRELEEKRLVRLAREAQSEGREEYDWVAKPDLGSSVRRGLARATAAISLGAAAVTRRLDDNVAEDVGLALGELSPATLHHDPSSACPSRQALFDSWWRAHARPRGATHRRESGPTHPLPASSTWNRVWQARGRTERITNPTFGPKTCAGVARADTLPP